MIAPFLLLGALLGVRHALEADHVAAVASLATRARSTREIVKTSAAWGFGHALTLVLLGSLVILLGATLSPRLTRGFEVGVGFVLIALGADVLRRLRRHRVHLHSHDHQDGTVHVHVHRHEEGVPHAAHPTAHTHDHPPLWRAVLVGGVHGLAGSAALVLLSTRAAGSPTAALAYLVAFAAGSLLGMVAFSLALSIPLRASARRFESSVLRVEALLGCATIAIGAWVAARAGGF